ncbi:major facilitator superfamily transporter [Penicillium frequentans]|uniref:Major facilitator superfamily transporter n=1 Tax=Penicillium frequentans TaxID=3151616 RepID=A0AAD6CNQ1_9EURO|nr:major facilitator superfamily transporter [Penicillium glabrum]
MSTDKAQEYHLESALPEGNRNIHVDPAVEKRVIRKLDWNFVPLVVALYLVSFLDRSNIGNAETAGMSKDLNETDAQYQWLLTIFYIPYILFEWMALMWKIVPPHIWTFATVFVWGLASVLQSAAFNWQGMMACRFFLAAAEAGFSPGIPYLLSFFYLRKEIGLRIGLFLSAAPLATCFAGALAYGITSGHLDIANWRLMFIVEGIPALILAVVAFFFLPDCPEKARFLTEEEQEVARTRAIRQVGEDGAARVGSLDLREVGEALLDPKNWLIALMFFCCNVSFSSLPVFTPTILQEMGFSALDAQGLSAPPYFLSFVMCNVTTWIADRTQQRGLVIITLCMLGGIGYVLLATCRAVAIRYAGIFLAAAGIFPAISNIFPWVLNNQGTDTKRGVGFALLQVVGQCGPILGTRLYPSSEAPLFIKGQWVCAAFMFLSALLAISLRTYLDWQNKGFEKKENEVVGATDIDRKRDNVAVENEGYGFRNVL